MRTDSREKKKSNHNGAVLEELTHELKHLRGLVRETGERFILRREGEIETIISHLDAVPPGILRKVAPNWLHEIRGLKLKPAKGRMKDLKEIDALIEVLTDGVVSAQEGYKASAKEKKG